jgi:hypothetical protein
MNCREFRETSEALALFQLGGSSDEQFLAHQRTCVSCAAWTQQQQRVAGALQSLRNGTAALEAPAGVEHAVVDAFRQKVQAATPVPSEPSDAFVFRISKLFGWGAFAAAAAALAISVGLGVWFWQHSAAGAPRSAQKTPVVEQPSADAKPGLSQPVAARVPSPAITPVKLLGTRRVKKTETGSSATAVQSDAQLAQSQGYVPLMLCDPLSCSGDEQVVRMELPGNAVDPSRNSSQPLMADVVVGDDGLVRAIRIVQQ